MLTLCGLQSQEKVPWVRGDIDVIAFRSDAMEQRVICQSCKDPVAMHGRNGCMAGGYDLGECSCRLTYEGALVSTERRGTSAPDKHWSANRDEAL